MFEVLARNCQSAVELSGRTIRAREEPLGMFTISPRQQLSFAGRLAIRARQVIHIITITINIHKYNFKAHPCNIMRTLRDNASERAHILFILLLSFSLFFAPFCVEKKNVFLFAKRKMKIFNFLHTHTHIFCPRAEQHSHRAKNSRSLNRVNASKREMM